MLTFSIFLRPILVAYQNGAMMETLWSFLIVKLKGSIEWNYLNTTPCNHTLIWMKGAHLFLQRIPEPRIASTLQFFALILGRLRHQIISSSRLGLLRRCQMNHCCIHFNVRKNFKQIRYCVCIYVIVTYIRHSRNLGYLCT